MKPSEEKLQEERIPICQDQINALNSLKFLIHSDMIRMGWHDDTMDDLTFIKTTVSNIHGEVSELWEAARKHLLREPCDKADKMEALGLPALTCEEEELADIIIRCFDTAGRRGIDIGRAIAIKQEFNMARGYRYGGKAA